MRAKIKIGYDRNIPCLYMAYAINTQKWIYSAKIVMNLQSCVRTCMYYCTYDYKGGEHHIIPQNAFLPSMNIRQVYARHIPGIYLSYLIYSHSVGLPGLPRAPGCLGPAPSADPFSFGHRKSSNSRLGSAKVPQPVVDLIYMAAPA